MSDAPDPSREQLDADRLWLREHEPATDTQLAAHADVTERTASATIGA